MQLALEKYEKNLFRAKLESQREIENLNQALETGKLENLTVLRARNLKKNHLKNVLEDQIKEYHVRNDAERLMLRS